MNPWQAFVDLIASTLQLMNDGLATVGIPYSFGFAIILFTVIIKVITYPLNKKQIESTLATQELQPKLKTLQKKYANDKEKLAQEQMALYKEAGVNPLGGCLPMLVQMPIWFALYRALYGLASAPGNPLEAGFFWIPSLAGPVTDATSGLSWLWPFPPSVGWGAAIGYLVLPVLLVVSQLYMQRMMTPQSDDPQQKTMSQMMMFMPFMFGYFALVVPSGLSLYWFTNNILSMAQQWQFNRIRQRHKEEKAHEKENKVMEASAPPEPESMPTEPKMIESTAEVITDGKQKETHQENGQDGHTNTRKPKTKSKRKQRKK